MDEIVDPWERLEALVGAQEPAFSAGFQLLVSQMKSELDLNAIADLLSRGQLEEAFTQVLRRAPNVGNLYVNSFVEAAKDTAQFLNTNLKEIVIDFDTTNPFSQSVMREEKLRMIREFTAKQRAATREALLNGIENGASPRAQARAFRDSIGLTENQVKAVNNYRKGLEQGDRKVLDRALRDKRFDGTVRRAFDSGKPLTKDQMNKMVQRYEERYIKYRADVIARTESLRSVHQGNHNMYQQAIESGDLDPNNLQNEWNTSLRENVRDSHQAMHGQKRPFNQPFVSGDGNQALFPGSFGVAAEDIQCACNVGTRITQITAPAGFSIEII